MDTHFGMDRSDTFLFHLWISLSTIYEQHECVFGLKQKINTHIFKHLASVYGNGTYISKLERDQVTDDKS